MYLFGAWCLLALSPSILAAEPPQALQQRNPANILRQLLEYEGKDLKDLVPSKDFDKDKDKPFNLTATITKSFAPVVTPSKDLPSFTTLDSDKDKTKDDKTYPASSAPLSAPTVVPSKDLPSFTTINSDKDKDKTKDDQTYSTAFTPSSTPTGLPSKDLTSFTTVKSDKDRSKDDKTYSAASTSSFAPIVLSSKDLPSSTTNATEKDKTKDDKTYQTSSMPSSAPVVLPSKDLLSSTTISPDKDKTKDDKTSTAASTPSLSINNTALTSDKDKDKGSTTMPLKDKTSSTKASKDVSSKIDSLTITSLASLTLSLISPVTTLPNSTLSGRSSALLTPPIIMYTVTLKPEKLSSTLSSSKTELSFTGNGLSPSKSSGNFSSQPSVTSGFGSTIFPGYSIVPSPSESGTKAGKGSLTNLTSATIPVWTQAMLGNAYGGGFVTTPSIFVTRLPFPSGPPGNVPPGYGVPSKSENSTLITAAPGNQTPAVTPVSGSIVPSGSTEAVKPTSPPYQNATGAPENGQSTSIFATVSSQPKKPEGPGGDTSSITLSLVPTPSNVEGTKSELAPTSSSPSLQSGVLQSMSFGFKPQSTSLEGSSFPSSVPSDKSIPISKGVGGKPEASEPKGFDTKFPSNTASGELPTASAAALLSSQLGLADTILPHVPSTGVEPGNTLPPLSTLSLASSFVTQYLGSFQQSAASTSIASSLGVLEGQSIPAVVTPSLGESVGGSVLEVQTTSTESSLGGHVGSTTPLVPISSDTPNLGNGVAGMSLPSSTRISSASSLGDELAGTTLPLVSTPSFASTLGNKNVGTTQPLVAASGPASTLGNENAGTTLPLIPIPTFASTIGNEPFGTIPPDSKSVELGGTSSPLTPTPSLASTLGNQLSGTTLPLVPTPSLVSSLSELVGTSLPFVSTSSLVDELGGTDSPFVSSPSLLSILGSEQGGATQRLLPTPSFASSSGELVDKTAPLSSTSATVLASAKPEGPTLVPTKTGEGAAADSTFASTLAGLKPESHGPVPTVSGKDVAAGSTLPSALAGLKPEGRTSAPTATGKDAAAESTSASSLGGVRSEGPTSVPTVTGNEVAAYSTTTSALAGLNSEGSGLVPTVSGKGVTAGSKTSAAAKSEGSMSVPTGTGKEVTAGLTATPTEESGSTSKASLYLSSGDKPKQATEGVVPSALYTATAQQSASTLSDLALGGGDTKSDTSLPFGGETSTGAASVSLSTPSLYMTGGVTGATPNPAAVSSIADSPIGTSGSVSGTVGPQSNASTAFNATPVAIPYFEGSAAQVTWSFGGALATFLTFLLWL